MNRFFHRVPNGVHDPISFYRVVLQLLDLRPNERFTARELVDFLAYQDKTMSWDSTTVGRILTDIHDSIDEAHGNDSRFQPIGTTRHWKGNHYFLADHPEAREVLARLADDLHEECEKLIEDEANGVRRQRLTSPLAAVPSLGRMAAA